MKKIIVTLLSFIVMSIHAGTLSVSFKVTGEGTQNFLACVNDKCGHNSSFSTTLQNPDKVQFYIKQSPDNIKNLKYKAIIWDKTCNAYFVCKREKNQLYSDRLCSPDPPASGQIKIIAQSSVKNNNLVISYCAPDL